MIQRTLFTADNGPDGRGLYITDGTQQGTRLLRDIGPGLFDPDISPLFGVQGFGSVNNLIVFSANGHLQKPLEIAGKF